MSTTCKSCERQLADGHRCPVCKPERVRAKECFAICQSNACGNWGTNEANRTGCLLLPMPCRTFDHIYHGGGCLADPPLFLPIVTL
jgi:hypothetical protein